MAAQRGGGAHLCSHSLQARGRVQPPKSQRCLSPDTPSSPSLPGAGRGCGDRWATPQPPGKAPDCEGRGTPAGCRAVVPGSVRAPLLKPQHQRLPHASPQQLAVCRHRVPPSAPLTKRGTHALCLLLSSLLTPPQILPQPVSCLPLAPSSLCLQVTFEVFPSSQHVLPAVLSTYMRSVCLSLCLSV